MCLQTQDLEAAKEQLLTDLAGMDSHLQAQTFLVGDAPSLADVALAVDLRPAFEKVPLCDTLSRAGGLTLKAMIGSSSLLRIQPPSNSRNRLETLRYTSALNSTYGNHQCPQLLMPVRLATTGAGPGSQATSAARGAMDPDSHSPAALRAGEVLPGGMEPLESAALLFLESHRTTRAGTTLHQYPCGPPYLSRGGYLHQPQQSLSRP